MSEGTLVLDADDNEVEPGSGVIGRVATTGYIPLRYHNAPEKTAETFVEIDGRRYVLSGDMATVEADGSVVLLGRGSVCINTGGEKVYPEEVEAVVKSHPDVYDAVVVGVPNERWGEQVTAVVRPTPGARGDPRRTGRALSRVARVRTRCRVTSWSSTRSSARPPARPTTAGPSRSPPRDPSSTPIEFPVIPNRSGTESREVRLVG